MTFTRALDASDLAKLSGEAIARRKGEAQAKIAADAQLRPLFAYFSRCFAAAAKGGRYSVSFYEVELTASFAFIKSDNEWFVLLQQLGFIIDVNRPNQPDDLRYTLSWPKEVK